MSDDEQPTTATGEPPWPPGFVTIGAKLAGKAWEMQTEVTIPLGPTRLRQMLPVIQELTNAVVSEGVRKAESLGRQISCKKGCGACCRQLVPVSAVEARFLRELIERLPQPRRDIVRARFADARRRLEAAGLLELLQHTEEMPDVEQRTAANDKYFQLGIACPFLEDESCSIYNDRPVSCREYLVTTPANNCAQPTEETVKLVDLPVHVWYAIARLERVPADSVVLHFVPLILAPEWAEAHPEEPPPRSGPEWLCQLFERLE
jgi:Fe-S-cluster containining protein